MEPIILKFAESDYNADVKKAEKVAITLQKYLTEFSSINKMRFTNELLKDLLHKGEKVETEIRTRVNEQLEAAQISSQSIVDAAVKGDVNKFWELYNRFNTDQDIKRHSHMFSLNSSGRVVIDESAKRELKEQYTNKITTEKGAELYQAHKKMIDAMDSFLKMTNRSPLDITKFYYPSLGDRSIQMPGVNYDVLV